jgi:hypothetical protein
VYDIANVGIVTSEGTIFIDVMISDEIVKPILRPDWKKCLELEYVARENLADDFEDDVFNVDCLIGCDSAYLFLDNKMTKGDGPTVQFSNIGCFVSGPLNQAQQCSTNLNTTAIISNLDKFNTDVIGNKFPCECAHDVLDVQPLTDCTASKQSEFDTRAFTQAYVDRIQYLNGEYHVPLPWKPEHAELPNNLETSKSRLKQVTARLNRLNLAEAYTAVMQENIEKGWITEVKDPAAALQEKDCYYLPHFFILKDSETTPLRIVFDASCGQPSLNSCLYEGPNMINDLPKLLAQFRTGKIGLVADIARAFLSVKLLESERKYVRFLWYKGNDMGKAIVPYHCNTIIFGNVSSPFSLAIVLSQHLAKTDNPVARDLINKLYVDNLLTSVDTDTEALEYYDRSRSVMSDGSFLLRQWASNSKELTQRAKMENMATKSVTSVATLGLNWDTEKDTLKLMEKKFDKTKLATKRRVLSETSSVFDPLGLVSPLIVPARKFTNELWEKRKSWDTPLSEEETKTWHNIRESLGKAPKLIFPRSLSMETTRPVTLVVFCDGTPKTASACVAYFQQDSTVRLIGSKNKLVVNSGLTTPKAELLAMTIGVKYGHWIMETYADSYPEINPVYLTDSEVGLHWINSTKKLTPFVKNRVELIRSLSENHQWYHVRSADNMADILSRGATFKELEKSNWLSGPDWLQKDFSDWPVSQPTVDNTALSSVTLAAAVEIENDWLPAVSQQDIGTLMDIESFGDYRKLLRVTS